MPSRLSSGDGVSARAPRIAGAVLAAGCSSRMGCNKLLLEWEGESLLNRAVRVAGEARLDPLIVVVGFEADRAAEMLAEEPCRIVLNPAHDLGMHSSAAAAADAVAQEAEALLIMLADMPLVTTAMLEEVQAEYVSSGNRLVVSRYGEVVAPPTLFDRSIFPHLQAMEGGNVKTLIEKFWSDAAVLDLQPSLLRDIDTPDDFEALRANGS